METAKEMFDRMLSDNGECTSTEMMIAFAKMHVEWALNAAYENCEIEYPDYSYEQDGEIDAASIFNAYPPENIK